MKIRIVNTYSDETNPEFLIVEVDVFKSKHQPLADNRKVLKIKKDDYYQNKKTTLKKNTETPQPSDIEIEIPDFENLGVFNMSLAYFFMLYQNRLLQIISRLI